MLESVSERLMETVHAGSPTKHPKVRLETIEAAGELKIPFTSGILVGIGETEEERVASLEALAAVQERHGHIQEVILQNFVPHPRYYGAEVADIAAEASEKRWSDPEGEGGARGVGHARDALLGLAGLPRRHEAAGRRGAAADARRRDPGAAEPLRLVGGPGRGGRNRSGRTLRQRRPHLPGAPVPEPAPGPQAPAPARLRAHRAPLRLPAVHERRVDGPRRPQPAPRRLPDVPAALPARLRTGTATGTATATARRTPPT